MVPMRREEVGRAVIDSIFVLGLAMSVPIFRSVSFCI